MPDSAAPPPDVTEILDAAPPPGDGGAAAVAAEPPPPPVEWNGELESLPQQEWWGSVPEPARPNIEAGLRAKYAAWQRGYQTRFTEFDTARKGAEVAAREAVQAQLTELQTDLEGARRTAKLYDEWFGKDSPEATDADAKLKDALTKLQEAEAERAAWAEERAKLSTERDEHRTWREAREKADAEAMAATVQAEADRWLEVNRDLYDDPDARDILELLIDQRKMDPDDAAAAVRRLKGIPATEAPATPPTPAAAPATAPASPAPTRPRQPDAIDVMSPGDTAPGGFPRQPTAPVTLDSNAIWAAADRAHRVHSQPR